MSFDKLKLKMMMEAISTFAPDLEVKVVERAKFDGKEWMAILIREKEQKQNERSGHQDKQTV